MRGLIVAYWLEPPTKGQPLKRGQKLCSQSVLYSEVPLYIHHCVLLHTSGTKCQNTPIVYLMVASPYSILQAVQYYIELLEHTDQTVRTGACSALSCLGVSGNNRTSSDSSPVLKNIKHQCIHMQLPH